MSHLKSDYFYSICHGLGNAVVQTAFCVGCESRGVEVVPDRCRVAEQFQDLLTLGAFNIYTKKGDKRTIGKIEMREGSLTDIKNRQFMTEANVVLVNNANDIFGVRSGTPKGKPTLDEHVAGLFAMMKPGTKMVTFHPLLCLGRCLIEENEWRVTNNLPQSIDASFFTCEKYSIGQRVVHWTDRDITVFLYTKVKQNSEDGVALFLCRDKKCQGSRHATPALNEKTGLLQYLCAFCGTPRTVNTRIR